MEFKRLTQKPVIDWMKGQVDSVWIDKLMSAVKEAESQLNE